eukprot:4174699-Alexandrium_andersonii.AAC.1
MHARTVLEPLETLLPAILPSMHHQNPDQATREPPACRCQEAGSRRTFRRASSCRSRATIAHSPST